MSSKITSLARSLDTFFSKRITLRIAVFFFLLQAVNSLGGMWIVRRTSLGSDKAGRLGQLVVMIADTPSTLRATFIDPEFEIAKGIYPRVDDGFSKFDMTRRNDDDFLLLSRFDERRGRYVVQIVRLYDGLILKTFKPDITQINRRSSLDSSLLDLARDHGTRRYVLRHPFLTPDGGLVFQSSSPLVAVDSCDRIKWTLDGIFHHSLERSIGGSFWIPETLIQPTRLNVDPKFVEDALAEISSDGKQLRRISTKQILKANGLGYLIEGRPYSSDPYHVNDIEPVLEDGPFWKTGDLFVSFRHLSLVVLYRPATNSVVWWKQGPWRMQHDVNILDDHRISVFDNAVISGYHGEQVEHNNQLLVYDFRRGLLSSPYASAFRANEIRTVTEGRGKILDDGDIFVEETGYGRIVRMGRDGRIRWHYITAKKDGRRYFLGWSRYLKGSEFGGAVKRAVETKCI
jgi:hypothetical protein